VLEICATGLLEISPLPLAHKAALSRCRAVFSRCLPSLRSPAPSLRDRSVVFFFFCFAFFFFSRYSWVKSSFLDMHRARSSRRSATRRVLAHHPRDHPRGRRHAASALARPACAPAPPNRIASHIPVVHGAMLIWPSSLELVRESSLEILLSQSL